MSAIGCCYITKTGFKENFATLNHKAHAEAILLNEQIGPEIFFVKSNLYTQQLLLSQSMTMLLILKDFISRVQVNPNLCVYSCFIDIRTMLIIGYCEKSRRSKLIRQIKKDDTVNWQKTILTVKFMTV